MAADQSIQAFSPAARILLAAFAVLLLPALLINLGLMTFIDDEAIRSLVALEMELSGNYIAPTLNGEWYYNKPPLFNWILLGYFRLFGVWQEWVPRLATVVSLLGYAATIFFFFRRRLGSRQALINALAIITCGRVLFWDSQLGLIDITFSWITFVAFMVVYFAYERRNWWVLFLFSYALTAAGFLMKGLPSVVFQGLTLLAFFAWKRDWKAFFSPAHLAGGLLFLLLTGLYYWKYTEYHTLAEVFPTLLSESAKRTAVEYGWWETVLHFFSFPFEMVYHFFPWSLGVVFFFHREIWARLRENDFVFFLILIFSVNIVLYWTSVEVYPRYLLMHAPLLFGVFFYLQEKQERVRSLIFRLLEGGWGVLLVLVAGAAWLPLFWERAQAVDAYLWKSALLIALSLGLVVVFWKRKSGRVWVVLVALLVVRLGFNWFVLPDRHEEDWGTQCKESTIRMAGQLGDEPRVFLYHHTGIQPTNSFYFTSVRQQILERRFHGLETGDYIIIDAEKYPGVNWEPVGQIKMRLDRKILQVGRYLGEKSAGEE